MEQVEKDAVKAVNKIKEWMHLCLVPSNNKHGIGLKKFVASELEFNTNLFGLKAKIDGVVLIENKENKESIAALEIKTGANKGQPEYKGQVFFYNLLMR